MLSLILAAAVTAATAGSADSLAPCGGAALQCTALAADTAAPAGDEAAGPAEAPEAAAEVESPGDPQSKDATTFTGGFGTWFNPCPWSAPFQHCNVYGSCFCSIWP